MPGKLCSKLPRPQGGALKPKFSKPKTEIPKQVRDDKRRRPIPCCHAELVSASDQVFSVFSRHTFHPRPCLPAGRHRTGFSGTISNKSLYLIVTADRSPLGNYDGARCLRRSARPCQEGLEDTQEQLERRFSRSIRSRRRSMRQPASGR